MSATLLGLALFLFLSTSACGQSTPEKPTQGLPEPAKPPRAPQSISVCELPLRAISSLPIPSTLLEVCSNHRGVPRKITKVLCKTQQGSLTFRPRLSQGDATSIVTEPVTCTTRWTMGTLNGAPRLDSFAKAGVECTGSCTLDFRLEAVDGAEDAVLVIVGEDE